MMYHFLRFVLFRMDAEEAHERVASLMRVAASVPLAARVLQALLVVDDPILATHLGGLRFANPLGLAAGFDKTATLVTPMALLGFGHVEVGTVTPRPQPGNPRPRLFRLPEDKALINRMGFNSPGMLAVAARLHERRHQAGMAGRRQPVVGVNIGKNRDTPLERAAEDYLAAFAALAPLADYVAVNISSPNTPGLRRLHERDALAELLSALAAANRRLPQPRPLLLKISPDESDAQIEMVVAVGCAAGVNGFIATNTTLRRDGLRGRYAAESGGLSGKPLAPRAQQVVAQVYRLTRGDPPVIGVGGVRSAADAYALIGSGAQLTQLYTGLVYDGPHLPSVITSGLTALLRRDGFRNAADAVGWLTPL
jgi:dihydroorotate dehydrogenase